MKRLALVLIGSIMMVGCSKHDSPVPSAPTAPANLNISGIYVADGIQYTLLPPCPNTVCSYIVNVTISVTQSGDELTGSYSDSNGVSGSLVGTVLTDTPTSETGTFSLLRAGYTGSQVVFSYTAKSGSFLFSVQSTGQNPFVTHGNASKTSSSSVAGIPGLGL